MTIHCVIHRQHFGAKSLNNDMEEALKVAISAINFVKANALHDRLFQKLCEGGTTTHFSYTLELGGFLKEITLFVLQNSGTWFSSLFITWKLTLIARNKKVKLRLCFQHSITAVQGQGFFTWLTYLCMLTN